MNVRFGLCRRCKKERKRKRESGFTYIPVYKIEDCVFKASLQLVWRGVLLKRWGKYKI
jgi:hypothetical protein